MKAPIRTQHDELETDYSRDTGLDFDGTRDLARQEFKDDADINNILRKFGLNTPQQQPTYGTEVDYTIDLQQALSAISQARQSWKSLPANLKEKYPDWQSLLNAIEAGTLHIDLTDQANAPRPDPAAPPAEPPKPPTP